MAEAPSRLDRIDRNILRRLQQNARISNLDLARAVHLSPSPCLRRHKLLESRGVIAGYTAIVAPAVLGFGVAAFIEIVLDRAAGDADTFRQAATRFPEVAGCTATAGDFDYLLKVLARDMNGLSLFVNEKLRRLPGVKGTSLNLVIDPDPALFAFYNYFHPGQIDACLAGAGSAAGPLDAIDLQIIKALIHNARLRTVDLARQIGQSHSACLRRLRALERAGIIRGYTTVIDPTALGRSVVAIVGLKLKAGAGSLQEVKVMLAARPEVAAVHEIAGPIDFLLRVTSADVDEYARFVRECLRRLGDIEAIRYSYAIDPLPVLFLSYDFAEPQAPLRQEHPGQAPEAARTP
jgi:Lrp/AsnC family leucine-responsive transcriptional regulator